MEVTIIRSRVIKALATVVVAGSLGGGAAAAYAATAATPAPSSTPSGKPTTPEGPGNSTAPSKGDRAHHSGDCPNM
jgi:hypothetical protein